MPYSRYAPLIAAILLTAVSCTRSTPASPSLTGAGATADTALTASVAAPRPLTPVNNTIIANLAQPVTLVASNAVTTQAASSTYTFQIASDAAFTVGAQSKDGVAEGANGQTSVRLDPLTPGRDYYWRVRATAGGTVGVFGAAYKFTIGAAITINPPTPVLPDNGASTNGQPSLTVTNATRTGPAGSIVYRFEISSTPSFATITATATVAEGAGRTSFTPASTLAPSTTYFWRVTAIDQINATSSAASATRSFTTSPVIDLNTVIYSYPGTPGNVASWRQTATILAVEQDGNPALGGPMCIAFSTSENWPTIPFLGDPSVQVYANQWYFANIGGQWYAGAGEYLRAERGFCKSGQETRSIGPDGGWISPMREWAPKVGELVGYMISTPARAGMRSIDQRSNIVVQPWVDSSVSGVGARRR